MAWYRPAWPHVHTRDGWGVWFLRRLCATAQSISTQEVLSTATIYSHIATSSCPWDRALAFVIRHAPRCWRRASYQTVDVCRSFNLGCLMPSVEEYSLCPATC
ncbi:hypothetical protein GY45DRAFT_282571 [Cubamyces sp. BRFM 1775]|nr:hypothetical protein GY45DRAFT_282571 [Cubamyces sp. BRFM 1775]